MAAAQLGNTPPYAQVNDDGSDSEDQEEFEKIHLENKREEIRKLLNSGTVSKRLYDRLEIFTAKPVAPEHIWKEGCKNCSTCNVCMETGGQTYVEKCQTDGFRAHLWRRPHQDGTYHYEVEYLVDPIALSSPLQDN